MWSPLLAPPFRLPVTQLPQLPSHLPAPPRRTRLLCGTGPGGLDDPPSLGPRSSPRCGWGGGVISDRSRGNGRLVARKKS